MIQDVCKILGDTGCAVFSFLYAIGQEPELLLKDFDNLVAQKIIGLDATVLDYSKLGIKSYRQLLHGILSVRLFLCVVEYSA